MFLCVIKISSNHLWVLHFAEVFETEFHLVRCFRLLKPRAAFRSVHTLSSFPVFLVRQSIHNHVVCDSCARRVTKKKWIKRMRDEKVTRLTSVQLSYLCRKVEIHFPPGSERLMATRKCHPAVDFSAAVSIIWWTIKQMSYKHDFTRSGTFEDNK